jgi:hypothetical protein
MTDTFWIIWFPSFTHRSFTPLLDKVFDKVTDIDSCPLFLEVALKDKEKKAKSDIDLHFFSTELDNNNNIVAKIRLQYQDHSSNGLFLYKCCYDKGDRFVNEIIERPRYATVFAIKKLFHRHTFHDFSGKDKKDHKDFYFEACVFSGATLTVEDVVKKLKTENNEFVLHYLKQFEYKYSAEIQHFKILKCGIRWTDKDIFRNWIEEGTRKIDNCEMSKQTLMELNIPIDPKLHEEQAKYEKAVAIWKRHLETLHRLKFPVVQRILPRKIAKILPKKIENRLYPKDKIYYLDTRKKYREQIYRDSCLVVGETLFINSLCHSKYLNIKIEDTDSDDVKLTKDEIRKLLLNIENLKNGLDFFKEEHRDSLNSQWNTKSIVLAFTGIILSGTGGIISILPIAKPFYQSFKDILTIFFGSAT